MKKPASRGRESENSHGIESLCVVSRFPCRPRFRRRPCRRGEDGRPAERTRAILEKSKVTATAITPGITAIIEQYDRRTSVEQGLKLLNSKLRAADSPLVAYRAYQTFAGKEWNVLFGCCNEMNDPAYKQLYRIQATLVGVATDSRTRTTGERLLAIEGLRRYSLGIAVASSSIRFVVILSSF